MNEDELFEIASRFRDAIEQVDLSSDPRCSEGASRLEGFPDGACNDALELLGLFLYHEYGLSDLIKMHGVIKENGETIGSHYWLMYDNITIDITADQFELGASSVIVTNDSEFHNTYAHEAEERIISFEWEEQLDWIRPVYNAVTKKYFELEKS